MMERRHQLIKLVGEAAQIQRSLMGETAELQRSSLGEMIFGPRQKEVVQIQKLLLGETVQIQRWQEEAAQIQRLWQKEAIQHQRSWLGEIARLDNDVFTTFITHLTTTVHHFDVDKQYKIAFIIRKFLKEHIDQELPELKDILNSMLIIANPSYLNGREFLIETNKKSKTTLESVCQYFDELKKIRLPENVYKRSFFGATACTFLPLDPYFPWVQKWEGRFEGEAEYVCSQFFLRSFPHLSIPRTYMDIEDITQRLFKYTTRMKLEGIVLSKQIPLLIEYKDGSNLKFMCQNIFESKGFIPVDEISKICSIFGEIAGYDFLIGNTDRLIPDNISNHSIDTYHKANGGNILIELDLANPHYQVKQYGSKESDQIDNLFRLLKCHVIDNAPCFGSFFSLREKKGVMPEDNDEDDYIFNTEQAYETEPLEIDSIGEELRRKMYDSFKFLINSSSKELEFIAKVIALGLKNECKAVLTTQTSLKENKNDEIELLYQQYEKQIIQGIMQGLVCSKEKIRDPHLLTILEEIEQERNYIKTTYIVIDFIKCNLKLAR